jgi:hypothetical protein
MLKEKDESVLTLIGILVFVVLAVYVLSQDVSVIGPF